MRRMSADGSPEDDERAAELAGDVVFEAEEVGGVASFVSRLRLPSRVGKRRVGFGLGLGEGDSGLEAADEGDHVSLARGPDRRWQGVKTSILVPGAKTAPKSKVSGRTPTTVLGVLSR